VKGWISRLGRTFPVRLAKAYGSSKAGQYAAGLAFNAFMTMFPLMLGILAIVGLVIRDPHNQQQLQSMLANLFPGDAQQSISSTLRGVQQHSGLLGVLSVAGLIWSGTGLLSALEFVLCEMFGVAPRDFLRQRVMALSMLAVFIVAVLVAVAANSTLSFARGVPFLGPMVGAIVMVGLVTIIYRVVPNRTFRLADVLPGAVLAGLLIEVVTLAFPIYARLVHGFNTYGATFALFFLLATWLYFVCQFILLGAVVIRMRLGRPGEEGLVPSPGDQLQNTEGSRAVEDQRRATS
jgi:membrane protein